MSRYVNKTHKLIIGSDNIFFITSHSDGEFRDGYKAIVWADNYDFNQVDSLNYSVKTPAQQILWEKINHRHYVLRGFWRGWLNENVGIERNMWDVRSQNETTAEPVFFRRRTDALKFVKEINTRLAGIK